MDSNGLANQSHSVGREASDDGIASIAAEANTTSPYAFGPVTTEIGILAPAGGVARSFKVCRDFLAGRLANVFSTPR